MRYNFEDMNAFEDEKNTVREVDPAEGEFSAFSENDSENPQASTSLPEGQAGDQQEHKPKAKKPKNHWVSLAVLFLILALVLGGWLGYHNGIQQRLDKQNATIMDKISLQLEHAYLDINAGNYENAKVRVEYIIDLYPNFPGTSDLLAEIMLHLETPVATATQVYLAMPTSQATSTPDLRGAETTFVQIEQLIRDQKWDEAIQNISAIRENHYDYKTVAVDGYLFIALRNRGIQKIYSGQLEQGIYDLSTADQLGALDGDADSARTWASMYLKGASFWDVNWAEAVNIFEQLSSAMPYLSDASGMTSLERYRIALYRLGDQYALQGDYCTARDYYVQSLAIGGNADLQATATSYGNTCAERNVTPAPPTETLPPVTETPTPEPTASPLP